MKGRNVQGAEVMDIQDNLFAIPLGNQIHIFEFAVRLQFFLLSILHNSREQNIPQKRDCISLPPADNSPTKCMRLQGQKAMQHDYWSCTLLSQIRIQGVRPEPCLLSYYHKVLKRNFLQLCIICHCLQYNHKQYKIMSPINFMTNKKHHQ